MKHQIYILTIISSLLLNKVNAQSTEDFESEVVNATSFTDNGQSFTISNNATGNTFSIQTWQDAGWNGTSIDQIFVDNKSRDNNNNGTSFIITTTDGKDIVIESLYCFLSTDSLDNTVNSILTIEGKKDGATMYTITKNSGFSDVKTFSPNNGYNFIDFSTEGGSDNSNTNVDQLVFTATNDGDYISLDAFTWNTENLSTNDFEINRTFRIFPNPTTEYIQVSGLSKIENYTIYNTLGTVVNRGIIYDNEKIEVANYPNGFYFLKLENGNTIKFLKE
mgnify:CR=1 FL=1|tara:strand:+ start:504 stop:1334 length:831 start_codon:yes stop_codon:yes gene_type:complete